MSFLVHTSIFQVNVRVCSEGYDSLPVGGAFRRLASYSSLFSGAEQVQLTRRRRPLEQEQYSNDLYPALDIVFDEEAVARLSATLFKDLHSLRLSQLSFRFLDYGFLYLVARFDLENSLTTPNSAPIVNISRCQKALLENFRTGEMGLCLFKQLAEESFIQTASSVAIKDSPDLLGQSDFDFDEHFTYATHLFLVSAPDDEVRASKEAFRVLDQINLTFADITVYLSPEYPLWISNRDIDGDELMYLLEADCLYLAEQTFHTSSINSYQCVLREFVSAQGDLQKERTRWFKSSAQAELLSSKQLRHLLIRNKLTITQIVNRTEDLDADQNEYIREYKMFYPLDQGFDLYKDIEETLKYVVHDQEQKAKEESDAAVEILLAIFTSLALLSVVNDLASFITMKEALPPDLDRWPWGRVALLASMVAVQFMLVFRFWVKRARAR